MFRRLTLAHTIKKYPEEAPLMGPPLFLLKNGQNGDSGTVEKPPHTVILTLNEMKGKNLIPYLTQFLRPFKEPVLSEILRSQCSLRMTDCEGPRVRFLTFSTIPQWGYCKKL